MMKHTLSLLLAATVALAMTGCGNDGGGDAPATSGGGSTPGTGTFDTNTTRHYRITTSWSPDIPTGVALQDGSKHELRLAGETRVAARTVNSTVIWGETTSATAVGYPNTTSTTQVHWPTAVPSCTYKDDLYLTSATTGTAVLGFDSFATHLSYSLTFTFPVPTNADGITSIKVTNTALLPASDKKHYVGTNGWTIYMVKASTTPYDNVTITPYNPTIMGAVYTDNASSTGLVVTLNRATTGGKLQVLNNGTNEILATFTNTTLVAGTPPDSTISVTLPFARPAGAVYRLVYTDPDTSDVLGTTTQGVAGVTTPLWP